MDGQADTVCVKLSPEMLAGLSPDATPPAPGPDQKAIETALFDAMDRAALVLLESLNSETVATKEGREAFRMAMDWLQKSRRLRPKSDEDLPMGVEGMREFIKAQMADAERPGSERAKVERARRTARSTSKKYNGEGGALAKALEAKR